MDIHPIYTEKNNCQDCYKCIRECPVKAIKIENHSASIISDRCIYCGHCITICPSGAKKVREDIKTVDYFVEQKEVLIASLAPSYRTEFGGWPESQIVGALLNLGFDYVSETALGAEMISEAVNNWLKDQFPGIYLSSCCPVVVDLIKKYYPEHSKKITPFSSPMLAHGSYLKQISGQNAKVVFIGPCIAKKKEAEKNPGKVDVVITFKKLREWMKVKGITRNCPADNKKTSFYPVHASSGTLYPIDGGMISGLNPQTTLADSKFMCFSGIENIMGIMQGLTEEEYTRPVFLELLACQGGCVNGPATTCRQNITLKRMKIIENVQLYSSKNTFIKTRSPQSLTNYFSYLHSIAQTPTHENEITVALQRVGKYSEKDELNCSGCGYENCRDFANAMINNIAEPTMCVSYMRRTAQRQASLLMQKMPYAVVLVDDRLNIIESNQNFAVLLGEDISLAYEQKHGLTGLQLPKLFSEYKHFENLIKSGAELIEKDIRINGQFVHISIFTIQKQKIVCGIMHAFNVPEIAKDEISRRSKEVISHNLKTVQKIAMLLGENASKTEAILNSLTHINKNG